MWDAVGAAIDHVRQTRRRHSCTCAPCGCGATPGSDAEQALSGGGRDRGRRGARPAPAQRAPARRVRRRRARTMLRDLVRETRDRVLAVAEEAARRPRLQTTEEVVAPMAPDHPERVAVRAADPDSRRREERLASFGAALPEDGHRPDQPHPGGRHECRARPTSCCAAPSCSSSARTWGARAASTTSPTASRSASGQARVFDTLLDETSILGIAQGAAHIGLLPVPEIQYLAYIHNALDQIRGEAASLQFFSSGQFRNPMVVRVPGSRLPEGLRRALPQRQLRRRAARHPRPGDRGAGARRRCGPHVPRRGRHGDRGRSGGRSSWSRSRSTTRRTCTPMATAAG